MFIVGITRNALTVPTQPQVTGAPQRRDLAKEQQIQRFRKALREASLEENYKAQQAYEEARLREARLLNGGIETGSLWQNVFDKPHKRQAIAALTTTLAAVSFAGLSHVGGYHMMQAAHGLQAAPLDSTTKMLLETAIGLVVFVAGSGCSIATYRLFTRNFEVNTRSVAAVTVSFSFVYIMALLFPQHIM